MPSLFKTIVDTLQTNQNQGQDQLPTLTNEEEETIDKERGKESPPPIRSTRLTLSRKSWLPAAPVPDPGIPIPVVADV